MTYNAISRRQYRPTCPNCGSQHVYVKWADATAPLSGEERQYVVDREYCLDCHNRQE